MIKKLPKVIVKYLVETVESGPMRQYKTVFEGELLDAINYAKKELSNITNKYRDPISILIQDNDRNVVKYDFITKQWFVETDTPEEIVKRKG